MARTNKGEGRKHLLLIVFKAHRAVNSSERALANKVQILELAQAAKFLRHHLSSNVSELQRLDDSVSVCERVLSQGTLFCDSFCSLPLSLTLFYYSLAVETQG